MFKAASMLLKSQTLQDFGGFRKCTAEIPGLASEQNCIPTDVLLFLYELRATFNGRQKERGERGMHDWQP